MSVSVQVSGVAGREQQSGVAGWILDRLLALRSHHASEKREMHLLETLSLGAKRQLLLVACGSQRYLVGVGAESVETIVALTEQPNVSLATKDEATP